MPEDPALPPPPRVGGDSPQRIGPYKILEVLGEGGMGTVYLAEQKQPVRRRVALKVVKVGMDSGQVLARFDLERGAHRAMVGIELQNYLPSWEES